MYEQNQTTQFGILRLNAAQYMLTYDSIICSYVGLWLTLSTSSYFAKHKDRKSTVNCAYCWWPTTRKTLHRHRLAVFLAPNQCEIHHTICFLWLHHQLLQKKLKPSIYSRFLFSLDTVKRGEKRVDRSVANQCLKIILSVLNVKSLWQWKALSAHLRLMRIDFRSNLSPRKWRYTDSRGRRILTQHIFTLWRKTEASRELATLLQPFVM